jgi:hypothetical protein
MRFRLSLAALAVAALSVAATSTTAATPTYTALNPGGPAKFNEQVPVQFVFLGYEPSQVSQTEFMAQLPSKYNAVVRSRLWYGVKEEVGLHYTYDYKVTWTDAAYENAFFSKLNSLAVPESTVDGQPRTLFQQQYNDQTKNVLDVGTNYFIDAPSVEKWLFQNPPAGIDPTRNTVFFVNWYGRPDFKFHTYVKFGEPDPDTGYDFGRNRQSRKIIAWGGTGPNDEETGFGARSRLWFYDLSAGPESWSDNWNVDNADVDGDGRADYRMPPIWEYLTAGGYHPASALSSDLGKVARYGAINLLFTSSPLYPPYITPKRQPASINLDLNTFNGWPGVDAGAQYQKPGLLRQEIGEVHRVSYNSDTQTVPYVGDAKRCYQTWIAGARCFSEYQQYPAFANLFLYNALNKSQWRDGGGEYEAGFFNYAETDQFGAPFLGFADDNWIDGTQSGTFNFISPGIVALGYGLTTTQIHEYGHHFGMSHPHDGYDSETGVDYGGEGQFYYVWTTDEVNSMMSYIDLNWDYSQFDLDNANRFQATAYMKLANAIAADVLASPNAKAAERDLKRADEALGAAQAAMAAHNYVATFDNAKRAYESVRAGAAKAGVPVSASDHGWDVLPATHKKGPNKKTYAYVDKLFGTKRAGP